MTVKTIICDDNPKARYILKEYLKKINIHEIELIGETQNGYELIEYCKHEKADLILLDIDMPFINGIETSKKILNFLPDASFIFITAYPNFSLQAFEIHAADYILKPVSIERFEKSLKYIVQKSLKTAEYPNNSLTFTCGHELHSVKQNDILFIERTGRKTLIHTYNKQLEVYESLNKLNSKLNSKQFLRAHNSYLINKTLVDKVGKSIGNAYEVTFKNYDKNAFISRRNISKFTSL